MKTGYSLLLQDYVSAEEVGYEDCREFQIVCPSCYEAVFKAGTHEGKRQYLSHYAQSKSDVDECELRVALISQKERHETSIMSRGQQLSLFQSVLTENLHKALWGDLEDQRFVRESVARMMSHKSVRIFAVGTRDYLRGSADHLDAMLWNAMDDILTEQKMLAEKRKTIFAKDFMRHLLSPNSFKSFLFVFANSILYRAALIAEGDSEYFHDELKLITTILEKSDRDTTLALRRLSHEVAATLTRSTCGNMAIILMQFPYFEILRGAAA